MYVDGYIVNRLMSFVCSLLLYIQNGMCLIRLHISRESQAGVGCVRAAS